MINLGGSVPLCVQSARVDWSGRPGWKVGRKGAAALMPELRLDGTPGSYAVLTLAPSCVTSMATAGGNAANCWCAQIGPGGRPSMGPVSPGRTPSSAVFSGCWVALASAVGAGLRVETALRGKTSKRGMGWVNGWTPKSGLRGAPVGMDAYALGANTLSPLVMTRVPAAVMRPMRIRSRRETCPSQNAFTISARFLRAFSASRKRAFDAFRGRYTLRPPSGQGCYGRSIGRAIPALDQRGRRSRRVRAFLQGPRRECGDATDVRRRVVAIWS